MNATKQIAGPCKILIACALLLMVSACRVPTQCDEGCISEEIMIEAGETFDWRPSSGHTFGDEDGMVIVIQANHAEVSEVIRNRETEWSPVYRYKSKVNFTGEDYVTLEIRTGSDGASPPANIDEVNLTFIVK